MKKLFAKLKHEHKGDDNPAKEQAPAKADGKPLSEGATVDAGRVKEIAAMVGPAPTMFGPPIDDRGAWDHKLAAIKEQGIITKAEEYLKEETPKITDELYLEFSKTGTRVNFEKKLDLLEQRMAAFALAECGENQGRFLPALEKELNAMLGLKTWVLPAHDKQLDSFNGKDVIVDLGAAQRGWNVSTIYGIMKTKLAADTVKRIESVMHTRLLDPYLAVVRGKRQPYHWWSVSFNWNAVCHAGCVGSALITIDSAEERAEFIASAEKQLPHYISGFADDGACPEGLSYWNYGFGAFAEIAHAISMATGNKVDLFCDAKIEKIAEYPTSLGMSKKLFPAFGDTSRGERPDGWLENFLYQRIEKPRPGKPHRRYLNLRKFMYTATFTLFQIPEPTKIMACNVLKQRRFPLVYRERRAATMMPFANHAVLESMGIHILRGGMFGTVAINHGKEKTKMTVSIKGGQNGIPHCHHDLGHFVIAVDGNEVVSDIGIGVYDKDSFGANRFKNPLYNSYGHATPYPAKSMQRDSKGAKAVVVSQKSEGNVDTIVFDLKSAYDVSTLTKLHRTYTYDRSGEGILTVTDDVEFSKEQDYGNCIITLDKALTENSPTQWTITGDAALSMAIEATGGEVKVTDESLSGKVNPRKPCDPHRLGINFTKPIKKGSIKLTFKPEACLPTPGPWVLGNGITKETKDVKTGLNTVKWCHTTPTLKADLQLKDWSDGESVTLNILNATKKDGAQIHFIAESRPDDNAYAYYRAPIPLDFEGWKEVTIPLAKFSPANNPVGWNKITAMSLGAKGWGSEPDPNTTLIIDGLHLNKKA